jgi:hypothetical protein
MRCPQRPFKCKLNQCGLFLCHKKFAKSRDEYFAGLFVDLELSEQSPWSITSGGGHGFGGGDFHGGGWRGSYGGGGYGLAGFGLAYYGGCYGYGCGYPYGYRYPDGYYGLLDPSATRDDTVRLANTQRGCLRLIFAESVDGPPAFRPAGLAYQSRRIFLTHHGDWEPNDRSAVALCDETDANYFREEVRHYHLDRRSCLYDWRDVLWPLAMRRLIEPWTAEDEERLKELVVQGASIIWASAALRRRKSPRTRQGVRLPISTPAHRSEEMGQ